MRASDIAIAMDELKVFQISELVDYLMEEWSFLGRATVKEKVKSTVQAWLRYRTLIKVNQDPPIFALLEYADKWEKIYQGRRKCPVCGTLFIGKRGSKSKYCSRKCYRRAKMKRQGEKLRKKARNYFCSNSEAVNKGKVWTESEINKLVKLRKQGKTLKEIAFILGRTVYSVQWKLKTLKEGKVNAH